MDDGASSPIDLKYRSQFRRPSSARAVLAALSDGIVKSAGRRVLDVHNK